MLRGTTEPKTQVFQGEYNGADVAKLSSRYEGQHLSGIELLPQNSGVRIEFSDGAYLQFNYVPNSMIGINISTYKHGKGITNKRILRVKGKDVSAKPSGYGLSASDEYDGILKSPLNQTSFSALKRDLLELPFSEASPTFWTESWANLDFGDIKKEKRNVAFRFERGSDISVVYASK